MKVQILVTHAPPGPALRERVIGAGAVVEVEDERARNMILHGLAWFPDSLCKNLADAQSMPVEERGEFMSAEEIAFLEWVDGGCKDAPAVSKQQSRKSDPSTPDGNDK